MFKFILRPSWVMRYLRRARRSRYAEHAINSVNAGYWVLGADAEFIDINDAYCRMVGYSRSQILSMQIADFEAVATQAQIQSQIRRIISKGQDQFETRHKRSDGNWVDLEITVTAIGKRQLIAYLRDVSDRKRAALEINQLAFFDPLTGLPNRRLLQDRIQQALLNAQRYQLHGAVLFIDLDHFKVLNDTLGHAKGDSLLVQVAQRLKASVRDGDSVARFGGDEFVVVIADVGTDMASAIGKVETVANKILESLALIYHLGDAEYHSTASIGISLFSGEETSAEDLLKHADLAMYRSKAVGRNALHFFDPAMQSAIDQRSLLEADLRSALRNDELLLHYQPQVNSHGQVVSAEALVRWTHPQRGLIQPNDFIPLAEESGLIVQLGQWVLRAACVQLVRWQQHPQMRALTLAVNVSAKQLRQADFVDQVMAVLAQTGANPKLLKLEITESVLVADIEDVIAKMNAFKKLGLNFALDDFGTGYSSLAYLSRLPVTEIKIDRSFVSRIETSENAALICVAVLSLARSLQMAVVAEGVETQEQLQFLTSKHQCDFVQGYLISRPLPIEAFAMLLAGQAPGVSAVA